MKISHKTRMIIFGALILAFFIGPMMTSSISTLNKPVTHVSETDPIPGEIGYSISSQTHAATRNVTIYQGNVMDTIGDWVLEGSQFQSVMDRGGVDSVSTGDYGTLVKLDGYHKFEDNYYDSNAVFRARPSFPVMNLNVWER